MRKIYRYSLKFEGDYITRWGSYSILNGFYYIHASVTNGGNAFPQARVVIGPVPDVILPYSFIARPIPAATEIDGFFDRIVNAIIGTDGRIVVDNKSHSDVKEFLIEILYTNTNVITIAP